MAAFDTESEVESRLENLRSELECYGKDIKGLVHAIYGSESEEGNQIQLSNVDLKNSPFQLINMLRQEILEIVEESHKQEEVIQRSQSDIKFCSDISAVLVTISAAIDSMHHFEDSLINFKFQQCLSYLADIEARLEELPKDDTHIGKGNICHSLRKEFKLQKVRLSNKIIRLIHESISIEYGSIKVNKRLMGYIRCEDKIIPDTITLEDLWALAVECEVIDEYVEQLTEQIWSQVLQMLWREKRSQIPKISSNSDFGEIVILSSNKSAYGQNASVANPTGRKEAERSSSMSTNRSLGSCKMPVHDLFELVGHVLNFVYTEVFNGNAEISQEFARVLFADPFLFMQELTETISGQMPKSESELVHYRKNLEEPCRLLQTKLQTFFSLSELATTLHFDSEPLTNHIDNIFSIFSFIRRRDILKHAREIVMGDYHNTMIASGDVLEDELSTAGDIGDARALLDQSGSIAIQKLKFDSCQVSLASCRLLKFVHEVMTQACHASMEVANVLFHSARDCIELFLIIVPTKFKETIETVPRMGAVFFNDCLYLAHNVVLISHRYRQLMVGKDEALQGAISFVDFIPRLRRTAENILQGHISSQQTVLREMTERIKIVPDRDGQSVPKRKNLLAESLKMAGKLKNQILHSGTVEGRQGMSAAAASVEGTDLAALDALEDDSPANNENRAGILLAHLERLSTQWFGVLQDDFYARMMGSLVDGVLQEAMKPVLAADCVTATAATEIYRIFRVLQRARTLLPSQTATAADTGDRGSLQSTKDVCPHFDKFCALTDMLEFKLNDIANGLNRKKFADFTAAEMVKLVRALFEESPRRQTLLEAIEALPAK